MAAGRAASVKEYLAGLPPDRRAAMQAVRKVILDHLPAGYEEGMSMGMVAYYVPLARFPDTYNGHPLWIAALASQKSYMSLHLMAVYGDPEIRAWFEGAFRQTGKRLDMGKACVHFKAVDDLPLDVIGQAIARVGVEGYLARYQASRAAPRSAPPRRKRPAPRARS